KGGVTEVSALKVWQDFCCYLYLPRLQNDRVLSEAISQGVESTDFFGFAAGKEDDKYLGFVFGRGALVNVDEYSLIIERGLAESYKASLISGPDDKTRPDVPPTTPPAQPPPPPSKDGIKL